MAGYDNANGPAGLVIRLIDTAVKALNEMSDAAGEIAPDVGNLTDTLVAAQRIADRASQDLQRLSQKVVAQ
ncbi:hypothetical protein D9623_19700 [Azospirillum brasilense]|jgi:ABC-type transporter Mla subunit MlaD|uniref:Uncharacterized protein n=1 Tax=Azospirillum brasilense TaxID=192 RepID=A0A0P0FDC7_AZOBR|nr:MULTISPECIES: hypothetical protein [Azospirillum]ALJ37674.1 hypothetical protein AMK58_19770 [Azospirillum brasilense]MDW7553890.1 hypothetical protein [Azospirillum brasilense]MDW7592671.1 hypothetical protein [Azospirillum brasilense]MDW7628202.1 hypothetical protein [Azospirillum brasilense]MDX5952141.1 hypothetical protein [Azospirillum brasilense]